MTLKEHQQITRAKYATACTQAKAIGKAKPNWERWKEQYNYYGNVTNIYEARPVQPEKAIPTSTTQIIKDNTRRQEKALKQINITIKGEQTNDNVRTARSIFPLHDNIQHFIYARIAIKQK